MKSSFKKKDIVVTGSAQWSPIQVQTHPNGLNFIKHFSTACDVTLNKKIHSD